jgi:hypothetical protein
MSSSVEPALISAAATIVSVVATATVAIVGFRVSRSTNQATVDASMATTDKTIAAARDANRATIDAAHADLRRTLDTTRDGQIADRYTRAIDQLGSTTVDVTIGGIYALERIANDSPRDHSMVMEVLSACIREHSAEQWPEPDSDGTVHERSTRPDIQAAITVIGRRDPAHDIRPIDLAHANLTGADLVRADFAGARLTGADLTRANLDTASLSGANLGQANLTKAYLPHVNFSGAFLREAHLTGATLIDADLTAADLGMADLTGATLHGVRFTNAYLVGADLTGARLPTAGNPFTGADLTGAYMSQGEDIPRGWTRDPRSGKLGPDLT